MHETVIDRAHVDQHEERHDEESTAEKGDGNPTRHAANATERGGRHRCQLHVLTIWARSARLRDMGRKARRGWMSGSWGGAEAGETGECRSAERGLRMSGRKT